MDTGRELDAKVAVEVMDRSPEYMQTFFYKQSWSDCYSTSMESVKRVIERMYELGFEVAIHSDHSHHLCYMVDFYNPLNLKHRPSWECAKTLSEAICLAALAAVKKEE